MPFPLDENPNIFTAEQKASNESTCEKLIGIEDKDQYPVCPKPYIFDIQNRVRSDPNVYLFFKNKIFVEIAQNSEHFSFLRQSALVKHGIAPMDSRIRSTYRSSF